MESIAETRRWNAGAALERVMVLFSLESTTDDSPADQVLRNLDRSIERVVLERQDPISGLLPASTAHTVHGDYGDAWVRDCVYSVQCVWALAIAHRRRFGERSSRSWELNERVLALMRGLLRSMMRQSHKVERFKHSLDPLDALHAKYDSNSGDPVVADDAWGHLQLDATSLFLLQLAQLTQAGLPVVRSRMKQISCKPALHRRRTAPAITVWERGTRETRTRTKRQSIDQAAPSWMNIRGPHGDGTRC